MSTKPIRIIPLFAIALTLQEVVVPATFAAPQDGTIVAGAAVINRQERQTTIIQSSDRAIINWREFGIAADEVVRFIQPQSAGAATLNRVTGTQQSVLLGQLDSNARVILINPNGVLIGRGAQLNVGSLIVTTSNIGNRDFMEGRLSFSEPGKSGAGIANAGSITASEGGLIALVAPHVRNDGLIQARLGRIFLGSGDTFTIDLYGDGLINLALGEQHRGRLHAADGQPVDALIAQNGQLLADGGKAVLVTARDAGRILDTVINMNGVIRAGSIGRQQGRIVLEGGDGRVETSGTLSATGDQGGTIEIFGGTIQLGPTAWLDASGLLGGGTIHVGGGWQGAGAQRNADTTLVTDGTLISVRATQQGDGGEAVIWSDGHTGFHGEIDARAGKNGGNGGRIEISGKQTLDFAGLVDAGASQGSGGFLLLDPATMNIGLGEAALINRVLRLGVSTSVTADIDINVNSAIDGRGRLAGGGLSLSAGNNINLNDYIITNNGAINLTASGGTIHVAAGKGAFAGNAPISITSGSDLNLKGFYTNGPLTARSTGGSLRVVEGLPPTPGAVALRAAQALTVDQPIASHAGGGSLSLTSDRGDIIVDGQIDGRNGNSASGSVNLIASRHVQINEAIVTQNAPISITAGSGTVTHAPSMALYAGNGTISVTAGSNLSSGLYDTTGALNLRSTGGWLSLDHGIPTAFGNTSLHSLQDLTIGQPILNIANGSSLSLVSDNGNVILNAQIDGRNGGVIPSGPIMIDAGLNILQNEHIVSQNGNIALSARHGTVTPAAGKGLFAGNGPISVTSGGMLTTAIYSTTGPLSLRSTGAGLTLGERLDETLGNVSLRAAGDVNLDREIANIRNGASLSIIADSGDININARIDAQDAGSGLPPVAGGTVTMTAGHNVNINESIVTNHGDVSITAKNGTVTFSNAGTNGSGNKKIITGSAPITITSGGNFSTGTAPPGGLTFNMGNVGDTLYGFTLTDAPDLFLQNEFIAEQLKPWVTMATTGKLTITSTRGNISIDAPIPQTTGELDIRAGNNVVVNEKLVNAPNASIGIVAGTNCTAASCIDLATQGSITVNNSITDKNLIVQYNAGGTVKTTTLSDAAEVDARAGNLSLRAYGDVIINEAVATGSTLSITSTAGSIPRGSIGDSRSSTGTRPQRVFLSAAGSIGSFPAKSFFIGTAGDVEATAGTGNFYADVINPRKLIVNAGNDIIPVGILGMETRLSAGRDVDITRSNAAGNLSMAAGRDVLVQALQASHIGANAGRHIVFDTENAPGFNDLASIWLTGGYNGSALDLRAGGNIQFLNNTGISILGAGPLTAPQPALSLNAGSNIEMRRLQTYGDVTMRAKGNITLLNYIGPHLIPPATGPLIFTLDQGVATLSLIADGAISMTGARAVGDIYISAGTTFSGTKGIVSTTGNRTILAAGLPVTYHLSDIETNPQMGLQTPAGPAIAPGPMVNPPPPPPAVPALPFVPPAKASVGSIGATGSISVAADTNAPGFTGELDEIPLVTETATRASSSAAAAYDASPTDEAGDGVIVLEVQSIAQSMDFGREGSFALSPPPTRR